MTAEQEVEAICERLERQSKAKELAAKKANELSNIFIQLRDLCQSCDLSYSIEVLEISSMRGDDFSSLLVELSTKTKRVY